MGDMGALGDRSGTEEHRGLGPRPPRHWVNRDPKGSAWLSVYQGKVRSGVKLKVR